MARTSPFDLHFRCRFLQKLPFFLLYPAHPFSQIEKPANSGGNDMKNQPKLTTSPATFSAIASFAVAWNRYSDHAYAAGGTLSGSSSVGLLVSGLCFQILCMILLMKDLCIMLNFVGFVQFTGETLPNFGRESRFLVSGPGIGGDVGTKTGFAPISGKFRDGSCHLV
ncbi:hypothetical protein Prudu_012643 [Prunus dulcis]|uniref:Uncharacterized protein n=1 Tax=Prunus dulcis TaxID=3755 RepID=A0A4Y1RDW7_PRUDU|nr:hypothetical protein Prudu_012643 [Prunus dulcis]